MLARKTQQFKHVVHQAQDYTITSVTMETVHKNDCDTSTFSTHSGAKISTGPKIVQLLHLAFVSLKGEFGGVSSVVVGLEERGCGWGSNGHKGPLLLTLWFTSADASFLFPLFSLKISPALH